MSKATKVTKQDNVRSQYWAKVEERSNGRQAFDQFLSDKRPFGDHPVLLSGYGVVQYSGARG